MRDIEYSDMTNAESSFDRLSTLPEELSNLSLFIPSAQHLLILELFVDAVQIGSTQNVEKLLSSSLLSQQPLSVPSLLARVWLTLPYSTIVRTSALDRFTQHLIGMGSGLDFQGFIPYLISALSDYSKDIRDAAANALTALHEIYSSSTKHSIIGLMELYSEDSGSTSSLKWLSLSEAKWLVSSILSKLTECRLDCNYIVRLLGSILNGAGKKGKKEQYSPLRIYSNSEILLP